MTPPGLHRALPCLPVTATARRELAAHLGFHHLDFRFYEAQGNLILRGARVEAVGITPLLRPLNLSELSLPSITADAPVAVYRHAEAALPCAPQVLNPSLWQEVLPFPLGLMLVNPLPSARLEFFPASWGESWRELSVKFAALESALAKSEVGCLWMSATGREPKLLLVHHVRKARTKAGLAPSLHELGEAYERGELTSERLWQTFGTQVSFFSLDLPAISEGNQFITLSEALTKTLELPHRSVEFRLAQEPPPEFQL